MSELTLHERFDAVDDDEYLKFSRIAQPRSKRPDLHAFLLLDELQPGASDIVAASEHDEIYLGIDVASLNKVISDEQVAELIRCGVRSNEYDDCLCMLR